MKMVGRQWAYRLHVLTYILNVYGIPVQAPSPNYQRHESVSKTERAVKYNPCKPTASIIIIVIIIILLIPEIW